MNPARLHQIVAAKRASCEPLTAEESAKGFRGWYSSKYLPHFDAPGVLQTITYRLGDSVPAVRWVEWKAMLAVQDGGERIRRIEAFLDKGYGACQLRDERVAGVVQGSFWHHDGRSYRLLAWAIMPNHVHVMIEQWETPLAQVVKSWKSYTAKEANKILGRAETFWAEDYFDRYVRDETHYRKVVRYMENNPVKVKLVATPEDWLWSSARYRAKGRQLVEHPTFTAAAVTHPTARRKPPPPTTNT
jgi:putative transposase